MACGGFREANLHARAGSPPVPILLVVLDKRAWGAAMVAARVDFLIEQGATFKRGIRWCSILVDDDGEPIKDAEGNYQSGDPYDLTDWSFAMQSRVEQQMPVEVDASTENGQILVGVDPDTPNSPADPTNGWIYILIPASVTAQYDRRTTKFDLEGTKDGEVARLLRGRVKVVPNITQEDGEPVVGDGC